MWVASWDLGKWFGPVEVASGEAVTAHDGTEIVGLELGDVGNGTKLLPKYTVWKLFII